MQRYWISFDIAGGPPHSWPPVAGVTGRHLADCVGILRHRFGPDVPPVTGVLVQPDLTSFRPATMPGGWTLGVPVWRGIWYPPENITGSEPPESQRSDPRWWAQRPQGRPRAG